MTTHTAQRSDRVVASAPARAQAGLDVAGERAAVRATLGGDVNAFHGLVEAHQSQVYGLAARMLGNPGDAVSGTRRWTGPDDH